MLKIRIIAFIFNVSTISSVAGAGYDCVMRVSPKHDPSKIVAAKSISLKEGIRSGNEGQLIDNLSVDAFISADPEAESVELTLLQDERQVGEKLILAGTTEGQLELDDYLVKTNCEVK